MTSVVGAFALFSCRNCCTRTIAGPLPSCCWSCPAEVFRAVPPRAWKPWQRWRKVGLLVHIGEASLPPSGRFRDCRACGQLRPALSRPWAVQNGSGIRVCLPHGAARPSGAGYPVGDVTPPCRKLDKRGDVSTCMRPRSYRRALGIVAAILLSAMAGCWSAARIDPERDPDDFCTEAVRISPDGHYLLARSAVTSSQVDQLNRCLAERVITNVTLSENLSEALQPVRRS